MSNSYWNKRLDAIPKDQSRKTGHNERTFHMMGLNWLVTSYHNTNIVIVDLDEKIIHLNTGGWDTVSTVYHINGVIDRVAREYVWAPHATVYQDKEVMHINVAFRSPHSVFRLQGTWGVHVG